MNEFRIDLDLEFSSNERAKTVLESVNPETALNLNDRSRTELNLNKNVLSIIINARDLTALRASFNSCLKLIIVSNDLLLGGN